MERIEPAQMLGHPNKTFFSLEWYTQTRLDSQKSSNYQLGWQKLPPKFNNLPAAKQILEVSWNQMIPHQIRLQWTYHGFGLQKYR